MIDFNDVIEKFSGQSELLLAAVDLSIVYLPKQLQQLREALQSKDPRTLDFTAHSLKGSLSIYNYRPAIDLAYQLELAARAGELDQATEILRSLETHVALILGALQRFQQRHNHLIA